MKKKAYVVRSKFKIMTSTVINILGSFFIIILVIFTVMFGLFQRTAKAELLVMGQKYSGEFENKIESALDYMSIVASMLESQAGTDEAKREKMQESLFHIFEDYKIIDASTIYFEPDRYDGKDRDYIGSGYGTDESGRICFYYYTENGETKYLQETRKHDSEFDLPHYTEAKEKNSPIYTEPYIYDVDGQSIHMFTVTYPINNQKGEFIGAVAVDVFLDDLYRKLQSEQIYKTGYIIIASDNEEIIYSPFHDDIGKNWQEAKFDYALPAKGELVAYSNTISPINNKHSFVTTINLHIPSIDSSFYILVSVPVTEIYSDLFSLIAILTLFGLVVISNILFVLRKNIVKPITEITENANKIAYGYYDGNLEFSGVDENVKTNNEIHILFVSLKKMFSQINEIQKIKLESIEFKHKKEKAEEASKTKSAFLAKMSHEIRTPMNAIVGMSELILRENNLSIVVYEHALGIKQAGANLLSIINDILDFSKIESGKLEIISDEYIFASLINDVLSIIRMRIMDTPIQFIANIDCDIPNKLVGDEARIRQILLNILGNAAKYTKEGFISIEAGAAIEEENSVILTIEISDSGMGIKEEDINKLFGDFIQVDTSSNKGIQGTGLGLAIARSFCQLMGGDISVRSEYGTGSTFTIRIPQKFKTYEKFASVENPDEKRVLIYEPRTVYANSIARTLDNLGVKNAIVGSQSKFHEELKSYSYPFIFLPSFLLENTSGIVEGLSPQSKIVIMTEFGEVAPNSHVRTIAMPVHAISVANALNDVTADTSFNDIKEVYTRFIAPTARVLIVDDITTNLKVAEGLMLPYKMKIDTCLSGAEAIELVKSNRYDAIFMDHMMPEMDGIETTGILRSLDGDDYYQNVPIIALTANAISGVKEMFLTNGMNDFLAKPIDTSKLNAILEKWIPHEKHRKHEKEKEEHTPVSASFKIEGVDVRAGISMTGGTLDNYIKTLTAFYKDGIEKIGEIKQCVETGSIKLFTTYVHAIKSASASIGASEISVFAAKLEDAGRNENISFIKENIELFLRRFEILLQHISAVTSESGDKHAESEQTEGDREFFRNRLEKLRIALESMDIGEINDVLGSLEAHAKDSETGEAIYNISQNILLFEYDEAISLIDKLLSV